MYNVLLSALVLSALVLSPAEAACRHGILPRKEWRTLSSQDQQRFLQALGRTMVRPDSNTLSFYENLAELHNTQNPVIHNGPNFLPWHRYFLHVLEDKLQEQGPITIPYWQWDYDSQAPELAPVWGPQAFGSDGRGPDNCVQDGYFAAFRPPAGCLQRRFNANGRFGTLGAFESTEAINNIITRNARYDDFRQALEYAPHGRVHTSIGGHMENMRSPTDPMFFLHHSNIDRIFALWQRAHPTSVYEGTGQNGQPVSAMDAIPAYNSRIADTFDMRPLCYYYEEMKFENGLPVQELPKPDVPQVQFPLPQQQQIQQQAVQQWQNVAQTTPTQNQGVQWQWPQQQQPGGVNQGWNQGQQQMNQGQQQGWNQGQQQMNQWPQQQQPGGMNQGWNQGQQQPQTNQGWNQGQQQMNQGWNQGQQQMNQWPQQQPQTNQGWNQGQQQQQQGNQGEGWVWDQQQNRWVWGWNTQWQWNMPQQNTNWFVGLQAPQTQTPAGPQPFWNGFQWVWPQQMNQGPRRRRLVRRFIGKIEETRNRPTTGAYVKYGEGPRVMLPVVNPIDGLVDVKPEVDVTVKPIPYDDRKHLLHLRELHPIDEKWLKLNRIPVEQCRKLEKETGILIQKVNNIPGYVSPAALWNRVDFLEVLVVQEPKFVARVNGTKIAVESTMSAALRAAKPKDASRDVSSSDRGDMALPPLPEEAIESLVATINPKQLVSDIRARVRESVLSAPIQPPVDAVKDQLLTIIGPPVVDADCAANPYRARHLNEKGYGVKDFTK